MHKNEHSHEMTMFWNRITVWSSLHEPVRISELSHGSVFESPVYRVHNEHNSKSPVTGPDLTERVRITATRNQTHELIRTHTRTLTLATYLHVRTCIHTRVHPYT